MIKSTIISRASDGLILCQTNDYNLNSAELQTTKHNIKKFQRQNRSKQEFIPLRQIDSTTFGIYFKQLEGIIYTVITQSNYPIKLANSYLETIANAFNDEIKNMFAGSNIRSKIQTIETSHYFVRFDKVVKQKKVEYEDVKSTKNTNRLKTQLDTIKQVLKINLQKMNDRTNALNDIEENSKKVSEQAKVFHKSSKDLKWSIMMKKYMFYIILVLMILIVAYLKFF